MFTTSEMCESTQSSVTVNGVDPDAMFELIEYAYTCTSAVIEPGRVHCLVVSFASGDHHLREQRSIAALRCQPTDDASRSRCMQFLLRALPRRNQRHRNQLFCRIARNARAHQESKTIRPEEVLTGSRRARAVECSARILHSRLSNKTSGFIFHRRRSSNSLVSSNPHGACS